MADEPEPWTDEQTHFATELETLTEIVFYLARHYNPTPTTPLEEAGTYLRSLSEKYIKQCITDIIKERKGTKAVIGESFTHMFLPNVQLVAEGTEIGSVSN